MIIEGINKSALIQMSSISVLFDRMNRYAVFDRFYQTTGIIGNHYAITTPLAVISPLNKESNTILSKHPLALVAKFAAFP